jgi:hypothetical protein
MKIKISLKSPKNYESNTNTNTTNYNLIEKEKQFLLLQDLISSKKQILIDYQSQFNNTLKQNEFLHVVKNDYDHLHNYIEKQKNDQIQALQLLNQYMNQLIISKELSKYNIQDAQFEQSKILKEIKLIKQGLSQITSTLVEHIL